jgi:hypothetical protein
VFALFDLHTPFNFHNCPPEICAAAVVVTCVLLGHEGRLSVLHCYRTMIHRGGYGKSSFLPPCCEVPLAAYFAFWDFLYGHSPVLLHTMSFS